MKISQDGLNKIVGLLSNVLNGGTSNAMRISNRQYSGMHLDIFFEEAEKNGNDAIGYDDFAEELWIRLDRDVNDHPEEADVFMKTWNAWVDLYGYLNRKGRLR